MISLAAVGCKPRLGRPSHTGLPVSGSAASVRHGNDDDSVGLNVINDAEWIPAQEIAPSAVLECWPRLWLLRYCEVGNLEFGVETFRRRRTPFGVPTSARLGLF